MGELATLRAILLPGLLARRAYALLQPIFAELPKPARPARSPAGRDTRGAVQIPFSSARLQRAASSLVAASAPFPRAARRRERPSPAGAFEISFVIAWAGGMGAIHGDAQSYAGEQVIDRIVLASGKAHAIGGYDSKLCLVGEPGELLHEVGAFR